MFVEEATRARCPAIDAATRNTFKRRVPKPEHWPPKGATTKELMAHADRQEILIETMGAAGTRVVNELDRCRGEETASPSS